MGRKKKLDLSTSSDFAPEMIDVTTLSDTYVHRIYAPPPYTITTTTGATRRDDYVVVPSPSFLREEWDAPLGTEGATISSSIISAYDLKAHEELRKKLEEQEVGDVKVYNVPSSIQGEHIVVCDNEEDLSVDRVLKSLSAVKGKLMLDVAPIHIQRMECTMTPAVKKNIIQASKKLKMYGKERPIIARFDEFGRRLPDEINLNTACGMTLIIVDGADDNYGEYYLEMKAIEFPGTDYDPSGFWTHVSYTDREDYPL